MSDSPENNIETINPISIVEKESDIPRLDNCILIDTGHTFSMRKDNPQIFSNEFSTIYEVQKGTKKYFVNIDLDQVAESELVFNDTYIKTLLDGCVSQFNNDTQATQIARDNFTRFNYPGDREKYLKVRTIYMNNDVLLRRFLAKLEAKGLSDKYKAQIDYIIEASNFKSIFPDN